MDHGVEISIHISCNGTKNHGGNTDVLHGELILSVVGYDEMNPGH
jgi:hypothetical protein